MEMRPAEFRTRPAKALFSIDQEGTVLLLSLVMLVLLSILGMAAVTNSIIENKVAGNERAYTQNFYAAEAGLMEGAQRMENIPDPITNPPGWLDTRLGAVADVDVSSDAFWDSDNTASAASQLPYTRFFCVSQGIAAGSSLDTSRSRIHAFAIYGRCKKNSGQTIIKAGYRKAF